MRRTPLRQPQTAPLLFNLHQQADCYHRPVFFANTCCVRVYNGIVVSRRAEAVEARVGEDGISVPRTPVVARVLTAVYRLPERYSANVP
jgi:hypothetical protein